MITKLRRLLAALFFKANTTTILSAGLLYGVISYWLMLIAGEQDLQSFSNFLYWLVVTGSTVGYGDYSPTTPLGKLFVSIWVIPVGLSIFALVIGRAGLFFSEIISRGKRGLTVLNHTNHTILIGWNGQRTIRLIELLLAKSSRQNDRLVLVVAKEIENPLPGKIDFVKAEHFSHDDTMSRANIAAAGRIIIDTPLDDVTLTTALYCDKVNPGCHTTAYFQEEATGELLRRYCPTVECIPSVALEMLAKSTVDPGSSMLHKQLLDGTYGMTQYSVIYDGNTPQSVEPVFMRLKTELNATLIGIRKKDSDHIDLNPSFKNTVASGDTVYYIAERRLNANECFE
ncbi:potassium channel protein [Marinibactrum halimedae]|uniref:Potassium channel protein n=1 Tax=Marinibactrum halimedae TaxID=1444977 RepID=A0AA37T7L1_9GAMM|nr:potassium channel family protein [Marinibactrum halimedae]MCD9459170.1 ion channel [Marinibactrum halimedae]GLS27241.1 potassium channel protein [Marinibactrum halimedae]